jgi:predicted nucleic acid-binding protein
LPDVICDTSPLQYLYQLDLLHILPALAAQVIVPPAVVSELAEGRSQGVSLPDVTRLTWVSVRRPVSELALPLVTDLGPGETQVLMLALETGDAVVVLDDALARRVAEMLGIRLTGTLGLLLDAKRAGLVSAVAPLLDKLQALRFRLAPHTRAAVLKLAGEGPE